ncbi:unnamed protein product [Phytophthora fragariaefolia]|uniref:Unnamed protein product n=1 Tax=Phytophthora fragariaefolia TaxID=1490495 RepID=A0A9W6XM55_9STRA|nr:unnamed protein product [Phytophthora fragariaefolia]
MVTPRSAKRQERVDRAADNSKATENTRRGTGKSMRRRYQPDDYSSSEGEAESRYYSAKREDKDHVCHYLNRLNVYARNAGIQFDNGGRKARDHVRRILETCGDRGPERRLCHRDIHELEEMTTDILRIEERSSARDNSLQHFRSRDHPRRREDRRHDDSRHNYHKKDRQGRDNDRRRDDSRNTPRISLAEASIADMLAELRCRDGRTTLNEFASARGSDHSDQSSDAGSERDSDDSWRSNEEWGDELSPDESGRYLAAANESERRAVAEGTYARSDNRQQRGDRPNRNFNRNSRPDGLTTRSRQPSTTIRALRCVREPLPLLSTLQRPFKLGAPSTETGLVPIGLPQLATPAIEAECIFAFVGKCEWPDDLDDISVNTTETEQERDASLGGGERNKETQEEVKEEGPDNWTLSARQEEKPRRELAKEVQLLPGERLGWGRSRNSTDESE